jgi:serine/threonine protein kinase/Tol biopolymer transport system component
MALQPGTNLGPYEILSLIGAGGMGEVYLAREIRLGRRVALKVLPAEFTADPQRIVRFEQEARSASALSHPNICTIFALGELPDGRRFIAMEYIDGHTLRHRLTAERVSLREALDISSQIASGVSAAHTLGIIHRDLKPENVLIRPDGLVKVVDFGLAKLALARESEGGGTTYLDAKTDPGSAVGTIAYMSPEQARAQEVDARTDTWSLGVLLYEMVAGRSPFAGKSSGDVLAAILEREPAPLARFDPEAPAELQRIVGKALRKDREQRHQSMKDLLLDLQALREDLHTLARSGSLPSEEPVPVAKQPSTSPGQPIVPSLVAANNRRLIVVTAAVLIAGLVAGAAWWMRARSSAAIATPSSPPVQRNLTRLTFGPGLQTDVTFSPDGRFVAYTSDTAGNFDIWVQPVRGGEPVQITKSPADDTEPDWSPDGSTIAFRSEREGGGLFTVSALGGTERRLLQWGYRPKFSPGDGSLILFSSVSRSVNRFANPKLYLLTLDGSEPREIVSSSRQHLLNLYGWEWYPLGQVLCLSAQTQDGAQDALLVPIDGKPPTVIKAGDSRFAGTEGFVWSPTGESVFFEALTDNGVGNIWRAQYDRAERLFRNPERLTTDTGTDWRIALTRDGHQVGFTLRSRDVRLRSYEVDWQRKALTSDGVALTEEGVQVGDAAYSEDGSRVIYTARRTGDPLDEVRVQALTHTASPRVFTHDQQGRIFFAWSRSGESLAYSRQRIINGTYNFELVRADVKGGNEVAVRGPTPLEYAGPSDWSSDDRFILGSLFRKNKAEEVLAPGSSIVLWPASSRSEPRVVTTDPKYFLTQARYSPDRRWISISADPGAADGPNRVGLVTAAGGKWRPITNSEEWADKPRWSIDGTILCFVTNRAAGRAFNVWCGNFDGTSGEVLQLVQITKFGALRTAVSLEPWSGSIFVGGNHLILPIVQTTGSLWMLDNVDK